MVSAEQQVYGALSNDAALVALIGTAIYPDAVPEQIPLPYIVFERTDTDTTDTIHDGEPLANKVTISISAWAAHARLPADAIADKVMIAMAQVGHRVARFSHYDAETDRYASVQNFEIWEV